MTDIQPIDRIIFCDFDGTITAEETFVGMFLAMKPDLFKTLGREIAEGRISLRDGVRMIIESMESRDLPRILEYVRSRPLRPGFPEFLDFLEERSIPFVIISGGLRAMIEARLDGCISRVHAVYAIDLDTSGEYMRPLSNYQGGNEMIAKAMIIESYHAARPVAIGDGITDFTMAMHAPVVFARDHLASHMEKKGKAFIPWEDYFDIMRELKSLWNE
jgi:2-hydroxy-3-keto-5-methylthiopentenyl-1-phosphate phosphatase